MIHIFLVNPYAGGQNFAGDLRAVLENFEGLNYYIFSSRYNGNEAEIIKRVIDIFEEEQLRFYICGGNGTFCSALNGFPDIQNVEIAFFPCGYGNDFLQVFGKDEIRFHDIKELIEGDVIDVDYIRTNHGVCLNSVSVGIDVSANKILRGFSSFTRFSRKFTTFCASFLGCVSGKAKFYDIYVDDERVSGKYSEVIFANGFRLGGSIYIDNYAHVDDGRGSVFTVPAKPFWELFQILHLMRRQRFEELREITTHDTAKKMRISSSSGENIDISLDGMFYSNDTDWEMEIVPRGLHLVVPKGVRT